MANEIKSVLKRRTNAYKRALVKLNDAEAAADKYEKENDGWLCSLLLDDVSKASETVTKTYGAMVKAEQAETNVIFTPEVAKVEFSEMYL